jgi:transposase InsO family protein
LPWTEVSIVDQRVEVVALARTGSMTVSDLCRRFRIARKTAYKWLQRFEQEGPAGLSNRSRRPHTSPNRTDAAMEAAILALRDEHPAWGGRKLAARLRHLGHAAVPSPGTITAILRRHARLAEPARPGHAWQHFEHALPNQLWQMDFKGHVPLGQGSGRLHPLTVLDDHSRYCLVLGACGDERRGTVQAHLVAAFRRYGLPDRLLMDNGAPWGAPGTQALTLLDAWLLQLGVGVSHGRPYHPQTQGKEERFHRTLKAEVLQGPPYADLFQAQGAFDRWRRTYNLERPHEACGLQPPVSRYHPSPRPYPELLPAIEYGPDFVVRRVSRGAVSWHGQSYQISEALEHQPVGLLPAPEDGVWHVYFSRFLIRTIDERPATNLEATSPAPTSRSEAPSAL